MTAKFKIGDKVKRNVPDMFQMETCPFIIVDVIEPTADNDNVQYKVVLDSHIASNSYIYDESDLTLA